MPNKKGHRTHFTIPDMSHIRKEKKMKRILGFDIDGVLYPWHEEVWKWFIQRNGEHISFIDFWKHPDGWISRNEGSAIVKNLVKETLPYTSAKINEADVSIVNDIAKFFDEIWYITSRPEGLHYDTAKWLKESGFPFADNLIMADGSGGKIEVVKNTKCDFYVEDRPKYLELLPEITNVFKMVTSYNTYKFFDAISIGNLFELYDYFETFGVNNE
jgi:uncharacterized HAD superfamily protein